MPWSTYLAECMGSVELQPAGPFDAGSYVSLKLVYTAGALGIDDTGGIKISFRTTSDMGKPQFKNPSGAGYTTAEASNGAGLECLFDRINIRPWTHTIYVRAMKGFLRPGDSIVVRIGDQRFGGPGIRMQTNAERDFPLKVFADAVATYEFVEVPGSPLITLLPGDCTKWTARLPTLRRPGETFRLGLMPLDRWGNATDRFAGRVMLQASAPVTGLPRELSIDKGQFGCVIEGLSVAEICDLVIDVRDADGALLCRSNPLRVAPSAAASYWADFHAQSGETVGAGTARDYFFFARDKAHLDIVGHQANDFQVTDAFWRELNDLYGEFNSTGRFVTMPGYEWSGNTGVGGDRNVYFPEEGRTIHRSSHMLVEDGRGDGTACLHVSQLFDRLRGTGALTVAHVGGRYADLAVGHDGRIETAVEVHSSWGTFEWILHDALALGHRVGVVCGSDDHKGRPGATTPGDSLFGAIGGLTCVPLTELSRSAIFAALRQRRHYGTTGNRLHLDVWAEFDDDVRVFADDPALAPSHSRSSRRASMGDIVGDARAGTLHVDVLGSAPIERVTVFDGATPIAVYRPFEAAALGRRLRVLWEGAEYRGRGRMVTWDGKLEVIGNRILKAEPINFLNPNKILHVDGERAVAWQSVTTGNFAGVDLWLADRDAGEIRIETVAASGAFRVADLRLDDTNIEAGGLGKRLRAFRLPDEGRTSAIAFTHRFAAARARDTALYVRVTQEDGHQAWSSPIYLIP
jgi:Protein of unknown function (DUF3604)